MHDPNSFLSPSHLFKQLGELMSTTDSNASRKKNEKRLLFYTFLVHLLRALFGKILEDS